MQYFASALTLASLSLLANLPLVTKVYFPRTLLPLAGVTVPLVDFVIGLPVLLFLMAKYHTWPHGLKVFTAPLFMLLAVVTVLGHRPAAVRCQRPLPRRALHDPRLPPGAAASLGRDVRGRPDPREVAVDPLAQPDDHGDLRLALGGARRDARPHPGQVAVGVGVALVLFVVGLAVFRSSEPRFADTI